MYEVVTFFCYKSDLVDKFGQKLKSSVFSKITRRKNREMRVLRKTSFFKKSKLFVIFQK